MADSFDKAIEYAADLDEIVRPGAFDAQEGLVVPLTVYTGGKRNVVGSASIEGNKITMTVDGVDDNDVAKMIRGDIKMYTAASFSFGRPDPEVVMIRGNYPGAIGKQI